MNFFLDTNAVIKIYHEETGTKVLSAFLKRYAPNLILTISDLTPIEFRSSFLRLARTGEADLIMVHEIFRHFDADITRFNIIKIEKDVKTFAILSYKFGFYWHRLCIYNFKFFNHQCF